MGDPSQRALASSFNYKCNVLHGLHSIGGELKADMRGSAVAKGLRSIADRLHPQLPLTSRESQQLLTALTTSFRRHLDEVHPASHHEELENRSRAHAPKTKPRNDVHKQQSSAAYADRHLASVLTNPLFAVLNPEAAFSSDYENAKETLLQNPSRDPVLLLEEYDKKGAATLPIAELCLETIRKSFDSEGTGKLVDLKTLTPGKRVFHWLSRNQLHVSSTFVESKRAINLLCYFLVHEGHESLIWDWLRLDDVPKDADTRFFEHERQRKLYQYRWKGRVLDALIRVKLGAVDGNTRNVTVESLHSAMDAFFTAFEMRQTAPPHNHLHWFPLTTVAWNIRPFLMAQFPGRSSLNVEMYEKMMKTIMAVVPNSLASQSIAAGLQLKHPESPSSGLAWNVAQTIFLPNPAPDAQSILRSVEKDGLQPKSRYWYNFLLLLTSRLLAENRVDDASWTKSVLLDKFPLLAPVLEKDLAAQALLNPVSIQKKAKAKQYSRTGLQIHDRVFVPSLG